MSNPTQDHFAALFANLGSSSTFRQPPAPAAPQPPVPGPSTPRRPALQTPASPQIPAPTTDAEVDEALALEIKKEEKYKYMNYDAVLRDLFIKFMLNLGPNERKLMRLYWTTEQAYIQFPSEQLSRSSGVYSVWG